MYHKQPSKEESETVVDSAFHSLPATPRLFQAAAAALIPTDAKDAFWGIAARDLLTGLFIYYYKIGKHSPKECIEAILASPIGEQLPVIKDQTSPEDPEYEFLKPFMGPPSAVKTLNAIYKTMADCLVKYAL